MTRRREIELHRHKLSEIREIMDSMKTLAYMETHKLNRFIDSQHQLVNNIDTIAADFLHFYPQVLPKIESAMNIILVIGSQRGFCGDFNEVLLKHFESTHDYHSHHQTTLVLVGQKLHTIMEKLPFNVLFIEGANVAEEISNVVEFIANTLITYKQTQLSLSVLHHVTDENSIITEKLLPPFVDLPHKEKEYFTHPPLLNVPPKSFLLELTEHYLFNALHRILYDSLMAENMRRVQHLQNAVNHLDDKANELARKSNTLRQEEIIEEIEIILLNESKS